MKITNTKAFKNINTVISLSSEPRINERYSIYVTLLSEKIKCYDSLFGRKRTDGEIISEDYYFYIPIDENDTYEIFIDKYNKTKMEGNLGVKYIKDFVPNLIITKEDYLKLTDTSQSNVELAHKYTDKDITIKDILDLGLNSGQMSFHDGTSKPIDHKKGDFGNIEVPTKFVEVYETVGDKSIMIEKYHKEVKEFYSDETGYVYDYEEVA